MSKGGGDTQKIQYLDYGRYLNHIAKVEADVKLEYKNIIQGEVKLTQRGKEVLVNSYATLSEVMKQLEFLLDEFAVPVESTDVPEFSTTIEESATSSTQSKVVPDVLGDTLEDVVCNNTYKEGSSLYLIENHLESKHGYRNAYNVMLRDFNSLSDFYLKQVREDNKFYFIYVLCCILRAWYEQRHDLSKYAHRLSLRDCYQKWIDVLIIHFSVLCVLNTNIDLRKQRLSEFKDTLLNWIVSNNNQNTDNGKNTDDKYSYKGVPPELRKYDMNTRGFRPSYDCVKLMNEQVMKVAVCIEDLVKPVLYSSSIADMTEEEKQHDEYLHSIRNNSKEILGIDVTWSESELLDSCQSLLFLKE